MEISVTVNAFLRHPTLLKWLEGCQAAIPSSPSTRPVSTAAFHCTLKALSRGPSAPPQDIYNRWSRQIEGIASDTSSFRITLTRLTSFPQVAWVAEIERTSALSDLHARLCSKLGGGPEPQFEGPAYVPHATVALSSHAPGNVNASLQDSTLPLSELVSEIQLVEWDVDRLAPRVIARYSLG